MFMEEQVWSDFALIMDEDMGLFVPSLPCKALHQLNQHSPGHREGWM
jgi:hypothetical protein